MIETPRSLNHDGEWAVSVFECGACGIDFFTEDHVSLADPPGFIEEHPRPKLNTARSRAVLHVVSPTRH